MAIIDGLGTRALPRRNLAAGKEPERHVSAVRPCTGRALASTYDLDGPLNQPTRECKSAASAFGWLANSTVVSEQTGDVEDAPTAPVWRITERSVEVAQMQAHMWLTFAGRALKRAREGGPVTWALVTESWAFVVAVDHLRNCAVMAAKAATVDGVATDITTALAVFDKAAPDVADLRNVLGHHDDEYVLGTGNLQQSGPRDKRVINEALAAAWGIRCGYHDPYLAERPWIGVGPDNGGSATTRHHLRVDLAETYQAASELRMALYFAACKQGLEPTNRPPTPAGQ